MKSSYVIYLLLLFLACNHNGVPTQPTVYDRISASLTTTDSLGYPNKTFHVGERFFLEYDFHNFTGKPQVCTMTDPICDITIWSGDSSVANFRRYLPKILEEWEEILPPNGGKGLGWLAPIMPGSDCCYLAPGNYTASVRPIVHFDSVEIEDVAPISFTVTQ